MDINRLPLPSSPQCRSYSVRLCHSLLLVVDLHLAPKKIPVKDLFPANICCKLQRSSDGDVNDVPPTYQDVANWAIVAPKPNAHERSRSMVVVYKLPLTSDNYSMQPVTLRLQGVLERHNVSTFGTWDRSVCNQPPRLLSGLYSSLTLTLPEIFARRSRCSPILEIIFAGR